MLRKGIVARMSVLLATLAFTIPAWAQGTVLPVGQSINGELKGEAADYTIAVVMQPDVFYRLSLTSAAFDPLLAIEDANGNEVARDDDGGEGTNALLLWVPDQDGTYTVRVDSFQSATSSLNGTYTLRVEQLTALPIAIEETLEVAFAGTDAQFFAFDASTGDVVNIAADFGSEDTSLTLSSVISGEVAFDDDGGTSLNPLIWRVPLPDTGRYIIELRPFADSELNAIGTLSLASSEVLSLEPGGVQAVTFTPDLTSELFVFTAAEGQTYRFTMTTSQPSDLSVVVSSGSIETNSLSIIGIRRLSFDFTAPFSGTFTVRTIMIGIDAEIISELSLELAQ